MGKIYRDPAKAAGESYDLIIVGGGVYGIMLSLEASRRKLRPLLLEKDDFGGATSYNSLKIIHGGLRYLQSLDLHRFRESVKERQWFLRTFPDYVSPLPCLMPLYGEALRHPFVMHMALLANDCLSFRRNRSVRPDMQISPGKVISEEQTRRMFPRVDTGGLKGGAVWHDAIMPDSQRILIEILCFANKFGASTLNYVEARHLIQRNNSVEGVIALDHETGRTHEFRSLIVINATGPWCREVAKSFDRDIPSLFVHSLAWNVLFKRESLSDSGLAVTPRKPAGQTYFLLPHKGMLLAGTGHAPSDGVSESPQPSEEDLFHFIGEINRTIPGLALGPHDVLHVYSGYLPVREGTETELTKREVIYDHGKNGGPNGLYTIAGIKFTTSRRVAEKVLDRIFPDKGYHDSIDAQFEISSDSRERRGIYEPAWHPDVNDHHWKGPLKTIIEDESVLHLDDLLLRRSNLGDNPERAKKIAPYICDLFDWDEEQAKREVESFMKNL
ncbi:MAG: FAD-dependent oxidoreductase [Deltaproteobacteria bacterium]|nr:FAD-dependent oxidoreductase [Deltaproteobacteria bacterium]